MRGVETHRKKKINSIRCPLKALIAARRGKEKEEEEEEPKDREEAFRTMVEFPGCADDGFVASRLAHRVDLG